MAMISYRDDMSILVQCHVNNDYGILEKMISSQKNDLTYKVEHKNNLYGYKSSMVETLSSIYGIPIYVTKFYFSRIETTHSESQCVFIDKLFEHLSKYIHDVKGYHIIRIPSQFVDVIKSYNRYIRNMAFCGGTVAYNCIRSKLTTIKNNKLEIFFADETYIEKHTMQLRAIAKRSFAQYSGQYHISSVTEQKASMIYENWLAGIFEKYVPNTLAIAQYNGELVGFHSIEEDNFTINGILGAVSDDYRNLGAYKAIIKFCIDYALHEKEKLFIISTQFDNFAVQGVWTSLGLKPYYSFYNFHIDNYSIQF